MQGRISNPPIRGARNLPRIGRWLGPTPERRPNPSKGFGRWLVLVLAVFPQLPSYNGAVHPGYQTLAADYIRRQAKRLAAQLRRRAHGPRRRVCASRSGHNAPADGLPFECSTMSFPANASNAGGRRCEALLRCLAMPAIATCKSSSFAIP